MGGKMIQLIRWFSPQRQQVKKSTEYESEFKNGVKNLNVSFLSVLCPSSVSFFFVLLFCVSVSFLFLYDFI